MAMKSIGYSRQSISGVDIAAVIKVLGSDFLTQGPTVEKFEKKLADYCQVKYVAAMSSGTAALHAAMFAIGIEPGDEVIIPPLSFAATANCVLYLGAKPVFADVVYETGLLDPKEIEKKITVQTKAIITVDYSGQPSYFAELRAIAEKHKLILVDDASHSLGAQYNGDPVGSQADITTLSFHPVKTITTGEGGAVATNNKNFYQRIIRFRNHGIDKIPDKFPWYMEMIDLGFNYRLTDIQCALGISQLKRIEKFLIKRRKIARRYNRAFENNRLFRTYQEVARHKSSWHLYPLRLPGITAEQKRELFRYLNQRRIFPQVHYIPIHLHPYYRSRFGFKPGDFPNAERFYQEEVSLPIYPDLTKKYVDKVVVEVKRFFGEVKIRTIRAEDEAEILEIRNESEVREASRNSDFIGKNQHRLWFKRQLEQNSKNFRVAVLGDSVVGYLRMAQGDKRKDEYEISIAVRSGWRQEGVGSKLMAAALSKISGNAVKIVAAVKRENKPSAEFFRRWGFVETNGDSEYIMMRL